MHKVTIYLNDLEFDALQAAGRANRRRPHEQAGYIVSLVVTGELILVMPDERDTPDAAPARPA